MGEAPWGLGSQGLCIFLNPLTWLPRPPQGSSLPSTRRPAGILIACHHESPSLSHPDVHLSVRAKEEARPGVDIPRGSRTSISGPGPLREMVTSFRLGSKGILHVFSPSSSWSVDSRCTLEAWIADSTHFSTWEAGVRSRWQQVPVMSYLCLAHPGGSLTGHQLCAESGPHPHCGF